MTTHHDPVQSASAAVALAALTVRAPEVGQTLQDVLPQLERILPSYLPVVRFLDLFVLMLSDTPDLLQCTTNSIMKGVLKAARNGFEWGEDCYLLPFTRRPKGAPPYKEAVFVPDYRGLCKALLRTDKVAKVGAEVVYSRDHFVCDYLADRYEHRPHRGGDRGTFEGAYGYIALKEGVKYVHFMESKDVERVHKQAPAGTREESAWVRHYDEMARKTAFKNTAKWCQETVPELREVLEEVLGEEPEPLVTDAQAQATITDLCGQPPQEADAGTRGQGSDAGTRGRGEGATSDPDTDRVRLLNRQVVLRKQLELEAHAFYASLKQQYGVLSPSELSLPQLQALVQGLEGKLAAKQQQAGGPPAPELPWDADASARLDRDLEA